MIQQKIKRVIGDCPKSMLCDLNSPFKPRYERNKKTAIREFINATSTVSRLGLVSRHLLRGFDLTATKVVLVCWSLMNIITHLILAIACPDLGEKFFLEVKNYAIGIYKGN